MPTDEAKLNELPGRFVTDTGGTDHVPATDRSHPSPVGTWTIDPAASTISFAWPRLRRWTITGRLRGMGVIHLDGLPPVGVVRFQQPSGLPVLTMTLDPASVETHDADLDAMLRGPDGLVLRGRGVLDRRALGVGRQPWSFGPQIQLDLAVRAHRAVTQSRIQRQEGEAA